MPIPPPSNSSIPARRFSPNRLWPTCCLSARPWSSWWSRRAARSARRAAALGASSPPHHAPSPPKHGERLADVTVTPLPDPSGTLVIALSERSLAQRMDRQLMAQGAVRSMHGMAAVLAHEIKNPLAGIRGAAQLLEEKLPPSERGLPRLICEESDRIRGLIDRMEAFGDTSTFQRKPVNIHEVLGRVRRIAETGFGTGVTFVENFDPSLPPVKGDRDQLIQVFLNLVRNAVDAIPQSGDV